MFLSLTRCFISITSLFIYSNSSTFLSAVLLVASSMYRIALPHINILTKVDLLAKYYQSSMPFNLDFYTECTNLSPLIRFTDAPFNPSNYNNNNDDDNEIAPSSSTTTADRVSNTNAFKRKHLKMTEGLCELLDDYGLVSFLPCNIEDSEVCIWRKEGW